MIYTSRKRTNLPRIFYLWKMILKKFLRYLLFWKKDEEVPNPTFNLKVMHGINKISILIFLIALVIMFIKFVILQ